MSDFRFDPFTNPPRTLEEAELQHAYFEILVQNLEYAAIRADPSSADFNALTDAAYNAKVSKMYLSRLVADMRMQRNWGAR